MRIERVMGRCVVVGIVLVLGILYVLSASSVWAQGAVPLNGDFSSGMTGWVNLDGGCTLYTTSSQYHSGSPSLGGAYSGTCLLTDGVVISSPVSVGVSAQLSFWVLHSGCGRYRVGIYNWTERIWRQADYRDDCTNVGWTGKYFDLSADAGSWVSVVVVANGSTAEWFDDFSISNSSQVYPGQWHNGEFSVQSGAAYWIIRGAVNGGGQGWTNFCGGSGNSVSGFVEGVGNPEGSLCVPGGNEVGVAQASIASMPFQLSSDWWNWNYKCASGNVNGVLYAYSTGIGMPLGGSLVCDGSWKSMQVNIPGWSGRWVSIGYYQNNGLSIGTYLDNLCPQAGCVGGTPTATPVPTNTPFNAGTPVPIGVPTEFWSSYPTMVAFPYGVGTDVPVYFRTPQPVYLTTPVVFPTEIYGKDTPAPVLVQKSPTPTFTPIAPPANPGGSVVQVYPTMISRPNEGPGIHLTPETNYNLESPFSLNVRQWAADVAFAGGMIPGLNMTIHYRIDYIDTFRFAGIDLMPYLQGLGAVFFFVFVVRQIQSK